MQIKINNNQLMKLNMKKIL